MVPSHIRPGAHEGGHLELSTPLHTGVGALGVVCCGGVNGTENNENMPLIGTHKSCVHNDA